MSQTNVTVSDFINTDYKDYSKYVLESRAIPSCIDGFKPSQRKILYTAIQECRNKKLKTASLAGSVVSLANYHHGANSLEGAINLMTAGWANTANLLEGEGNFGSRLVNDAAAPRYTYVKLSKNYDRFFLDSDVIDNTDHYKAKDFEDPEPIYYLPVIPWALVNGIRGIAIGYATNILPRSPEKLVAACQQYIKKGKFDSTLLTPVFPEFKGDVRLDVDSNKWIAQGTFTRKGKTHITVTEIPPEIEREKYIEFLNKLEDENKIVSYVDKCSKVGFLFDIVLPRGTEFTDEKIIKLLKLEKSFTENITTIDENRCLRIFDTAEDLLKHFCEFRLKQYSHRFAWYIKRDTEKLNKVNAKLTYLNAVVYGKINFTKSTTKSDLFNQALKVGIPKEHIDMCISMPSYSFCTDTIRSLETDKSDLVKDINRWQSSSIKETYLWDLSHA